RRDRGATLLSHGEKMMRMRGCLDRVDRDLHVAVRTVLESDGTRQSGRKLAMHLAHRPARAERAPRDELRDGLRRHHVEELAARRQTELVDVAQELASDAKAFVDVEAAVEIGVIDQALPTDSRARLLEIDTHHDLELVAQAIALRLQTLGIFDRGRRVVDRAGPDDDDQPVVLPVKDALQCAARLGDGLRRALAARILACELGGRDQLLYVKNAQVIGANRHCLAASRGACLAAALQKKTASFDWRFGLNTLVSSVSNRAQPFRQWLRNP